MAGIIYFANPCGPAVLDAMVSGKLGFIDTPAQGNARPAGVVWCADNGCFGKGFPGELGWLQWLGKHENVDRCAFATAPDIVGDAPGTLARSLPLLPDVRALGFPAALVAQDGLEDMAVPWSAFDALFIGGSTEWKLGPGAAGLAREARHRGKWVHMGRVNSRKRLQYAADIGCHSADGTYLVFGPRVNLPKLLGWLAHVNGIAEAA